MLHELATERRLVERIPAPELSVKIKIPGKWSCSSGKVIDFNRHGLSLICEQPLPVKGHFFLTLKYRDVFIQGLVGILHNCRPLGKASAALKADAASSGDPERGQEGYRCGVRFRPGSCHQFDCHQIRRDLKALELRLLDR